MQYEFVKKDDDVIETEEMKFQKFTKAMEMVAEKADPGFNILIDRTIEVGFDLKACLKILNQPQ
jgi:hypothetical protein